MIITLFSEIPKTSQTLYAFDIDKTTLYYPFPINDEVVSTIEELEAGAKTNRYKNKRWEHTLREYSPCPYDRSGMEELKKFCDENDGMIIFLTARLKSIQKSTVFHLQLLYPWVSESNIYLCDGVEKGKVLFDIVAKHHQYKQVVFVDDIVDNIESVKRYIPLVTTYRMVMKPKLKLP